MEKRGLMSPEDYLPLVKIIVNRIDIKLPSHLDQDDLISYGILGLMDALEKFKAEKEVKFETYASIRIRGAIIDAIRKAAPVSRGKWDLIKRITEAREKLSQDEDQPDEVSLSLIAEHLNISVEEANDAMESLNYFSHVSIEETLGIEDASFDSPEASLMKEEQTKRLANALSKIQERERLVLTLYYYEELAMKEIAEILEVGVPRVSQIKSKALASLRKELEEE